MGWSGPGAVLHGGGVPPGARIESFEGEKNEAFGVINPEEQKSTGIHRPAGAAAVGRRKAGGLPGAAGLFALPGDGGGGVVGTAQLREEAVGPPRNATAGRGRSGGGMEEIFSFKQPISQTQKRTLKAFLHFVSLFFDFF